MQIITKVRRDSLDSFKVDWKLHVKIFLIQLIILFLWYEEISSMLENTIFSIPCFYIFTNSPLGLIFLLFAVMFLVCLIHELIHGFTYRAFGGSFRLGFKGIYAYCQETSGIMVTRTQFLAVLLMPVIIISIIGTLFPRVMGLFYILNLFGSIGDIYMALYLCKLNKSIKIIDRKYGFDIIK